MKTSILALLTLMAGPALANQDLSLPGARWLGKATGYVCPGDLNQGVKPPLALEKFAVAFDSLTTDYSLDNALITASFMEDKANCRYSALVLADNAANTLKLVDSRAYATAGTSSCASGKMLLDQYLAANTYLYWGHPHHVTVVIDEPQAADICGPDATTLGLDFVLAGRL